jgi:hypothetical protein
MIVRFAVLFSLFGLFAGPLAGAAAAASETSARPDLSGIWSGDQGILWDTSAKEGQRPQAPFTPAYAARYQEALDAAAAGRPKADPPAACLPPGVPRILASPFPFEIVQTSKTVFMLFEYMSQVRRIYMEGSGPPPLATATFNGHSTGRWEGDTLIIETVGLHPDSVLDTTHLPHSDELRVVERWRLVAPGKLEAVITLIDPKAYTKPWTVRRTYTQKPGERILQYVCEENNRNPVLKDGSTGFIGTE